MNERSTEKVIRCIYLFYLYVEKDIRALIRLTRLLLKRFIQLFFDTMYTEKHYTLQMNVKENTIVNLTSL